MMDKISSVCTIDKRPNGKPKVLWYNGGQGCDVSKRFRFYSTSADTSYHCSNNLLLNSSSEFSPSSLSASSSLSAPTSPPSLVCPRD